MMRLITMQKKNYSEKRLEKIFFEGKVTLPLITIFQKGNEEEKEFLTEIMKKERKNRGRF